MFGSYVVEDVEMVSRKREQKAIYSSKEMGKQKCPGRDHITQTVISNFQIMSNEQN